MKVVAIIQARMGSSRLPGKVMKKLAGTPMIGHVVERALRIDGVDQVVVATTRHRRDEPLVRFLSETTDILVVRGPETDVLARYVQAAEEAEAETVVRLTADCPLICPAVSTRVVREFLTRPGDWDYVSNTLRRTYPRGLDTEVVSFDALTLAHREAHETGDREHVTPFIRRQPDRFRVRNVSDDTDRSWWRLTVDTREDLDLVSRVYSSLYSDDPFFDYTQLLECLERHPDWSDINQHVIQKEK